jgi:DNA-binding NarL/FixJ family response regulator
MKVSILIFEDNDQLRDSTVVLLKSIAEFDVVGAYPNVLESDSIVKKLNPDVILMDISMPGRTGTEAVKEIRKVNPAVHIIMLTIFDNDQHVYDAICAGASGYLLKRHIGDKLVSSIHEVLEGGAPMSPSIAKLVVQSMQGGSKAKTDVYQLTAREKEILSSLSNGNSYKLIAVELDIRIDTVRSHIRHIYEKLQVHSQTEAVSKAIQEKLF